MNGKKKLKIALIGTRGAPANYGGFETCVEEVGSRLIEYGHDVTVYCRKGYYQEQPKLFKGMKLIYLPHIKQRSLETLSHSFLSVCHGLFKNFDIYMVFNSANSPMVLPLKVVGKVVIINTDGLEWKRSKWGIIGRWYYKISERLACYTATRLVSDSKGIKNYYQTTHKTESTQIAYGAYCQRSKNYNYLKDYGLKPYEFFLQITRFEPENHPLLSILAFKKLKTNKKLLIIGGNPYPTEYTELIKKEAADSNVILPGFIYDKKILKQIWCFAYAYIHGNSVGGTNPALLQAMASKCFVIASNNLFNRDVLKNCGIYYDADTSSLLKKIQWSIHNRNLLGAYKERAVARISEVYSWEKVARQYEKLFYQGLKGGCY